MKKYTKPFMKIVAFDNKDSILQKSGLSTENSNSKFNKSNETNAITLS